MFGLIVWVVIGIGIGAFTFLILFLLGLKLLSSSAARRTKSKKALVLAADAGTDQEQPNPFLSSHISPVFKDIKEVVVQSSTQQLTHASPNLQQSLDIAVQSSSLPTWSRRLRNEVVAASMEAMPLALQPAAAHPSGRLTASKDLWDGDKEVVTFEYTSSQYEARPHFQLKQYLSDAQLHVHEDTATELCKKKHGTQVVLEVTAENEKGGLTSTFTHETMENDEAINTVVASGWWGQWYTLAELEVATNQFAAKNIVGEGGYGVVYQGQLPHGSRIAVKNLLNSRGQAGNEFLVEVEAIGRVRHKNLVRLMGCCAEGARRLLIYEYVNNGNLDQWLHGSLGKVDPVPWDARMKIILGVAKGLAYLHEDVEPKVVHRDVKSSNILLDDEWNAKISDFGLAKLLGEGMSHVTTRVMGTFGYVAPEYASTGLLTESSDVYSFGVLMMELITGRNPVDYSRPVGEINLVDWMKMMVRSRKTEEVADPRLCDRPPSGRALKKALLVALRCVDPDALKRPRMGHVVHMLEADDIAFPNVCRSHPV